MKVMSTMKNISNEDMSRISSILLETYWAADICIVESIIHDTEILNENKIIHVENLDVVHIGEFSLLKPNH